MLAPLLDPGLLDLPLERRLDYPWDEPRVLSYFYFGMKPEFNRLDRLTSHANMALAIAVCEWIDAWLSPFDEDPTLEHYIEAGWAALLDRGHTEYFKIVADEWRGPARGPKVVAIGIINEIFFESSDEPRMAYRSCYALNLARHLMRDWAPFHDWAEAAIKRLEDFAVAENAPPDLLAREMPKGALVSREAMILARPYQPAEARDLLVAQMRRIGSDNPFFDPDASQDYAS